MHGREGLHRQALTHRRASVEQRRCVRVRGWTIIQRGGHSMGDRYFLEPDEEAEEFDEEPEFDEGGEE